ncbi:MAG TPA: condensation domain-containing protein, partial [Candidatus Binatia bacterium]|nr:condensation domain-containing protein [Candidatus Binatia bacterium]
MTAAELVAHLRALDIRLTVDGDRLRCSAPRGALSDALRAELALRKAELVQWLRAAGENPDVVTVGTGVDSLSLVTSHPGSEEDFPLSFAQERLWFLDQLEPGSTTYSIAARRKLRGPLDVAALTRALRDLVQRHESLRSIFPDSEGAPVQRIGPPELVTLEIADLEREPAATRAAAALRLVREHARRPFALASGPLFRPVLIRLGPDDHELCIVVHHIVADGWSLGILVRDLTALYEARLAGRPSPLPELPVRYVDFALWQRHRLSGEVLDAHRQYWRERLAGLPDPLQLPSDRPRFGPSGSAAASHDFAVPRPLADGLRALSRRENATL